MMLFGKFHPQAVVHLLEIDLLLSLPIPRRDELTKGGAVYFVIDETDEILYIGKAKNLKRRWKAHHCCADLDKPKSTRVAWLPVKSEARRGNRKACHC